MIKEIVKRSLDGAILTEEEIASLFQVHLFTRESAMILAAARKMSEKAGNSLAEVHAQVGLNIAPCPKNCSFCSFAAKNKVFRKAFELPVEEAVYRARQFEADGANAVYLMTTANYSFEKFIDVSQEIRKQLRPETVLIANLGDFNIKQAIKLRSSGFSGIYHAVRMEEGRETTIPVEKRLETFKNANEAGLTLGTCVEPIGNEHTVEELVEKTIITRDAKPAYSGAARRIPIPDTEMAKLGIVSEARMAHILATIRLAIGYEVPGNCTHEPNVIGSAAGANLLWAEAGSNPRDTEEKTEGKRGMTVKDCVQVFQEAEWRVLKGPSKFYEANKGKEQP